MNHFDIVIIPSSFWNFLEALLVVSYREYPWRPAERDHDYDTDLVNRIAGIQTDESEVIVAPSKAMVRSENFGPGMIPSWPKFGKDGEFG